MAKKSPSAEKAWRQSVQRYQRNRGVRSALKTHIRKAEAAVFSGETAAAAVEVRETVSALDRAAKKGVIHPNKAARHKARLMKKYNAALA